MKISASILNTGKSPAVHLLQYSVFKPWLSPPGDLNIPLRNEVAISQCFKPKPRWSDKLTGTMLLPGVTNVSIPTESPVLNKDIVDILTRKGTKDEHAPGLKNIPQSPASAAAKKLTVGLVLVGCIDYFDQFRDAHRTFFCYLYQPLRGNNFMNCDCPRCNSVD